MGNIMINLKKKAANSWNYASATGNFFLMALVVICIMALVALIVLWPWAVIWAFNGLFGTVIPCNFWTWLQVIIITLTIRSTTSVTTKK